MKTVSALIVMLLMNVAHAQIYAPYTYPALIQCKPSRVVSVDLFKGIAEDIEAVSNRDHTFEYIENGIYRFKKSGMGRFTTKFTNQGFVLNLYAIGAGSAVSYSIDLYGEKYVGASSEAIVGATARGSLTQGNCKIHWK